MKNKENSVGSVSRDYVVGITIICTIEYIKQTKSDIEIKQDSNHFYLRIDAFSHIIHYY